MAGRGEPRPYKGRTGEIDFRRSFFDVAMDYFGGVATFG